MNYTDPFKVRVTDCTPAFDASTTKPAHPGVYAVITDQMEFAGWRGYGWSNRVPGGKAWSTAIYTSLTMAQAEFRGGAIPVFNGPETFEGRWSGVTEEAHMRIFHAARNAQDVRSLLRRNDMLSDGAVQHRPSQTMQAAADALKVAPHNATKTGMVTALLKRAAWFNKLAIDLVNDRTA